jgi:undecaprenyl-diphosphatase
VGFIPHSRRHFGSPPIRSAWKLDRLDAWEMPVVRWQVSTVRQPPLRYVALALNHLGNGWLYLALAIILFLSKGWAAWQAIWPAIVSIAIAHGVYPIIKSHVARPRPIDRDPTLAPLIVPLDAYSCPSGHCMTAVAIFTPLALMFPQTLVPLSILAVLIGWARLAAAHHYPSDLLLGGILGAGIALPVSWPFLP